ncbi:hypothetical protein CEP54_005533 [Fusarium duplospermum]|uniref:Heterokaryon incompatibility domain-containing protein n=1 Tax=Fusarium duplospermum TaxID=1325734 RepID=A0A428QC74_9HYPO|nr:hypothetical protein CEP54_005533 [Fusarium duplospermum]
MMPDQEAILLDTECDLGEPAYLSSPLERPLTEDSVTFETLSSDPQPCQGTFVTPENDSFYKLYSYNDLNSKAQDIRLIHVFRDEQCDLIQCEFLPQSNLRGVSGNYHTLSYCAGDPLNAVPVLLQGIKFNVFANLNHALEKTLSVWKSQYPGQRCVLWVDQICINQRNDVERSHQVGLMRDIYTNSRGTFISLSTADSYETSSNGLDWVKELAEACQPLGTSQPCQSKLHDILGVNLSNPNFLETWASFYEFFQCPWWRRAWVHQEFICSPDAVFMYHSSTIFSTHTSFLLFLCQTLQNIPVLMYLYDLEIERRHKTRVTNGDGDPQTDMRKRNRRTLDSLRAIELLLNTKETWRGDEDLKKILARSRYCRSSDPRDRIFAFLGLARPGYGIEADYSKSNTLDATILHTAKKIFEFDRHLEILAFAVRATKRRESTLPSWAPDWASTEVLADGHFTRLPGLDKEFQNDAIGSLVIHTSAGDNTAVLRVQGLQIDTLKPPTEPTKSSGYLDWAIGSDAEIWWKKETRSGCLWVQSGPSFFGHVMGNTR